jgi:hypothetical protein
MEDDNDNLGASGILPPRASFFGVRSLSLVLLDFGVFSFLLLFILNLLLVDFL